MPKYWNILVKSTLLKNIASNEAELENTLAGFGAQFKQFNKNNIVIYAGDTLDFIAVVLKGILYSTSTDIEGNRIILHKLVTGDSFGASVALLNDKTCPLTVTAMTDTVVLLMPISHILEVEFEKNSKCGTQIIKNVLELVAEENISLHMKNDLLSQKTTRDKLMLFFANEKTRAGGKKDFLVPFNRDEMADYLCVNRSAMSRELSKMRDEGLLEYNKNKFRLK